MMPARGVRRIGRSLIDQGAWKKLGASRIRVDDENRNTVTVKEAAEYLGLTRTRILKMVDSGLLKADKFAGAVHIPREEVERIERETAP
jgi:excisionase family DNA binding protein